MGAHLKVAILANGDPTSSAIFRAVCDDPRLKVVCVAFTATLTKSQGFWQGVYDIFRAAGLSYFIYVCFWNGVFSLKEWLMWHLPFLKQIFPEFFSLKLWARNQNIDIVSSPDFNAPEFLERLIDHQPDVILTRINQILKEPILNSAPHGCWCFHSSELPKYQGIAAEFHSLLNDEQSVGFTVMQMERKLDNGPIIKQGCIPIPDGITLHRLIQENNLFAQKIIHEAIDDLLSDQIKLAPQNIDQKSYFSWPTSPQTQAFRQKGLRYISFREAISYLFA